MDDKKAIYIEIQYDDGTADIAKFTQAEKIWEWYLGAAAFHYIHGAEYGGPKFTRMSAAEVEEMFRYRDGLSKGDTGKDSQ